MKKRDMADCSPYDRHVGDDMMSTHDGSLTQTIVATLPVFTAPSREASDTVYAHWKQLLDGISREPDMALWIHLERRARPMPSGAIADKARPRAPKSHDERPLDNRLYVSTVCRATDGRSQRTWDRDVRLLSHGEPARMPGAAKLVDLTAQVRSCLQGHRPVLLGLAGRDGNGGARPASELIAFYARLMLGADDAPGARAGAQAHGLDPSGLHFGADIVAIDTPAGRRYVAALTMIAPCPPERIQSDVFEALMAAPLEFVLSQSITATVIDRSRSLYEMEGREGAEAALPPQPSSMFEHELVLLVYADSVAELEVSVRRATALLARKGMHLSCEQGSALICAYFGVLPGNFRLGRLRAMPASASGLAKLLSLRQREPAVIALGAEVSPDETLL